MLHEQHTLMFGYTVSILTVSKLFLSLYNIGAFSGIPCVWAKYKWVWWIPRTSSQHDTHVPQKQAQQRWWWCLNNPFSSRSIMPLWNTVVLHCCSSENLSHNDLCVHLYFIPNLITNNHSFLPSCCFCHLTSFLSVPLVITRASDQLNASSVSGTAASSRRHQQGEWKAIGETYRPTTAADMVSYRSCSRDTSNIYRQNLMRFTSRIFTQK